MVLFDEIEEGAPRRVPRAPKRILDEGRLADSRTVDFRNAFLITTSNVGAETVAFVGRNDGEHYRGW